MTEVLEPRIILVYGSANNRVFKELQKKGIRIVQYKSATAAYFERKQGAKDHE